MSDSKDAGPGASTQSLADTLSKYITAIPVEARFAAFTIVAFISLLTYLATSGDRQERIIVVISVCGILIVAVLGGLYLVRQKNMYAEKLVLDAPPKGSEDGKPIKFAYDLFVAAPMAALAQDSERKAQAEALGSAVSNIKQRCSFGDVFYAGFKADVEANFDEPSLGLKHNIQRMRASKRFMLVYTENVPTSALIELGMAMALAKPSVLFIKEGITPPYLIQGIGTGQKIDGLASIRLYKFKNFDQLNKMIASYGPELFDND